MHFFLGALRVKCLSAIGLKPHLPPRNLWDHVVDIPSASSPHQETCQHGHSWEACRDHSLTSLADPEKERTIWALSRENLSSRFPKKGVSNQSPQLD